MRRTQIQITEEQIKRLKRLASTEHKSIAELIRQAIDIFMRSKGGIDIEERQRRAIAAAGRFHSRLSDLAEAHDKYLAEDFHN